MTAYERSRYEFLKHHAPEASHDRLYTAALSDIPLERAAEILRMGPLPPLGAPVPVARRQVTADMLLRCIVNL